MTSQRQYNLTCIGEYILDYQGLIETVYQQGWVVVDDFLTTEQIEALKACLPDEWLEAGVGRADQHQDNQAIRRDKIQWLEPTMGLAVSDYLAKMEQLRLAANQRLLLGLFDYEAHFARYREGDFYATHRDAFAGRSNRRLTTVCYLNQQWHEQDGGLLRVYDDDEQFLVDITPKGGRLVVFLSEEFPHEVLPAKRERFSIAGWFRINGTRSDRLDPSR